DFSVISILLLYINTIAYIALWGLTLIRLFKYFPRFRKDMMSHEKGPGFFTLVAGTCVFGSQIYIVTDNEWLPLILWVLGIFLWVMVMYTFFISVTIRKKKPRLSEGINGAWLIAAVGTQSVSVLGRLLSPRINTGKEILLYFTLFMFLKLDFKALSPPYWINMGAVAITSLAGATLILHAGEMSLLTEITPFLKGFTVFFWVTGTWWIPLLFILMIWRHVVHKYPLT